MQIKSGKWQAVWIIFVGLFLFNAQAGFAHDLLGGVAFTGEREGVCVLIEGEFIESIYFKLDTCDENQMVKEEFKDRTPFTLLVPKGEHRLVIMKEGHRVLFETIEVEPEKTLYFKLPKEFEAK